jgi:uncharacterized damage-inducible protein DinB
MVEEAIRMWETFRAGVVAELVNIPEEQWGYRPGPGARSVRELAVHIASSAIGFVDALVAEDASFARLRDPKVQEEIAASLGDVSSKASIIALLKQRGADDASRLRANAARLNGTMPSMKGEQSRVTGLWFAASHEMYHRGQLATYARAVGLVPALTQQISGR